LYQRTLASAIYVFEQKFPLLAVATAGSISATLHGANNVKLSRAKPSGSEKFHYWLRKYFGSSHSIFFCTINLARARFGEFTPCRVAEIEPAAVTANSGNFCPK